MGLTQSKESCVEVDLKVDSVDDLDLAIKRLQEEKVNRSKVDPDLVCFHLDHIERELEEKSTQFRMLSLEHLELFEQYLKRLSLPMDPKIDSRSQRLLKTVSVRLSEHPLAGRARSGDTAGGEHGSAYLKVPLGRRRQMCVLLWFNLITGPLLTLLITFLLWYLVPFSNYLLCAYIGWVIYSSFTHTLPRKDVVSQWWRKHAIFKYFKEYFPIRHTMFGSKPIDFDSKKHYLMCYHPHGVQAAGAFAMASAHSGVDDLFPGLSISVQTLKINFQFPFTRENILGLGMGDASKKCLARALGGKGGSSAVLVTGGARESLYTQPYSAKVVLKDRKGFVRVALRTGAALVPMWGFGENNLYENLVIGSPRVRRWQRRIQKLISFAPLFVAGRGVFSYSGGLIPHRRPITVVVGKPIFVGPPNPNFTSKDQDRIHAKYLAALKELYEKHKDIYDPKAESISFI